MPAHSTEAAAGLLESLELVGVGVGVETFGNHPDLSDLWQAIQQRNGGYLISQKRDEYPQSLSHAARSGESRISKILTQAANDFMDTYPLPLLVAGAESGIPDNDAARQIARVALAGSFVTPPQGATMTAAGVFTHCPHLYFQRGQVLHAYLHDQPDLLWDALFDTLETHTDAPIIGVAVRDGVVARAASMRDTDRAACDAFFADAMRPKLPRILSDNCTMLTLVHRPRVDALRPFATKANLYDGMQTVTHRGRPWRISASCFAGWRSGMPQRAATPYLRQPWTGFQIEQFDNLPQLGVLYRPQIATFEDEGGQPVAPGERQARLAAALQAALAPLAGEAPARLFYDYGSVAGERIGAKHFGWLSSALKTIHPDFDLFDPRTGIDLAQCLGELGAGSAFVAVALASMAGMQSGGATLIANLRRERGVSFILMTPPSLERRQQDAAIARPLQPRFYNR